MMASRFGVAVARLQGEKPPKTDLEKAYLALSGKLNHYNLLWKYYDGDQPLMYASKRLDDIFKDLKMRKFTENWCSVVIDVAQDRIQLKSLSSKDAKANKQLALDWEDLNLAIEASDVHEAALVIGESFLIVGDETDDEGEAELQVYYNDARNCHLFYEPSNPRKKRLGVKWWVGVDGHIRITLYYPDRFEYYRSNKAGTQVDSAKAFKPFSPNGAGEKVDNPNGEIPFFHFRLERRIVKSDLTNAIPLQNGINKLNTDMMVAAEYGAFMQRWIISDADISGLKNAPNKNLWIPAGDGTGQGSSVGQFTATDLDNYIKAIDSLASAIAVISRTPKHYLFSQGGTAPSGEALIAMEAPLNKRCEEHIAQFIPVWKDVARFMLKVRKIDIEKRDIIVTFAKPETIQPGTQAEIRVSGRQAGIPLTTLLREEGKDDAWIEQMEADRADEGKDSPMLALLEEIRKKESVEVEGE